MPKKSTVAIATSQTNSQANLDSSSANVSTCTTPVYTLEQAQAIAFKNMSLFAVYVMTEGLTDSDGIIHGVPHYVGTAQTRKEANEKGLHALTRYKNAITCEIKDISNTPFEMYIEGSDREGWVTGLILWFATQDEAHAYANGLYERGRFGITFTRHAIRHHKLDYFTGIRQPPKWFGSDLLPLEYVYTTGGAL